MLMVAAAGVIRVRARLGLMNGYGYTEPGTEFGWYDMLKEFEATGRELEVL